MRLHFLILGLVCIAALSDQTPVNAQQPAEAPKEEVLMPDDLTRILKEEWQFLKDATDAYLKTVEKKAEFETKAEYNDRVERLRQTFISKVNSHIAEKKFDKRVFAVLFKANLISYSPDTGKYIIKAGNFVEAPYNTPTIRSSVPPNNYVGLADSVRRGYRTSALYLKFRPNFKWTVGRDAARNAKNDEASIFFKVLMALDLTQSDIKNQANIKIIPKEISLINNKNKQKLWDGGQIRLNPPRPKVVARKKNAPKPAVTASPMDAPKNLNPTQPGSATDTMKTMPTGTPVDTASAPKDTLR